MARYELILKLDEALWLRFVFKPLLTPKRVIESKKYQKHRLGARWDNLHIPVCLHHSQAMDRIRADNEAFAAANHEMAILRWQDALAHADVDQVHALLNERAQAYASKQSDVTAVSIIRVCETVFG